MRRRHRLPQPGPPEPDAVGRRGAAHQPDDGARHLAGEHAVCARRAQHRTASARYAPHHRGDATTARRRQHAGGGRARPGRDAGGRPDDRHGAGAGGARRSDRLRRQHAGPAPRRYADRRLPRRAQAGRHGLFAPGGAQHAAAGARGRARAQPQGRHGRDTVAAAGMHHRCERLGQVDAGAGRAGTGAVAPLRATHRCAGPFRAPARRRTAGRCGVRRPVADWKDGTVEPGQLCGRLGRDPRNIRQRATVAPAQLHRDQVQLQRGRRPLPHLRWFGLRACGDAVSQRRLPALPRLRRQALPARNSGGAYRPLAARAWGRCRRIRAPAAQPECGRGAEPDGERGGAAVLRRPRRDPRAAADHRRRPGIRQAGSAGADAVGRRGAATQARRFSGRGGEERQRKPSAGGPARNAVHVRRADHRPAFRRHRQTDARAAPAARRRPFAAGHRAQPRRDPRQRLADRPWPRRRRRRRATDRLRKPRRPAPAHGIAHRTRAARVRQCSRSWRARRAGGACPVRRASPCGRARAQWGHAGPPSTIARRPPLEFHPDRQRQGAQPQVAERGHTARQVQCRHRRERFGQVDAGF